MTPAEFKDYYDRERDEAVAKIEIKGFRPGTAPKELAEKAIDKEKIFDTAAREAVRRSLDEISKENHWTLIDSPKIEITEASPMGEAGLRYKAELTIFPDVKLGNYKKIAQRVLKEKQPVEVAPEEIEKSLAWLQKSRAALIRADRPARGGDAVEADIEGFADGKAIAGGKAAGDRFVLGESHYPKGFDEKLEGHRAGDNFRFSLSGENDKSIDFAVKVKTVFDRRLPELNDDFAKGLGSNFKSLDDVRKSVGEGIKMEKERRETDRRRAKMLQEIAADSQIDAPEIMVERTLDGLVADFEAALPSEKRGNQQVREALRPKARENVINNLLIYKIAQTEHLEPTPEETEGELNHLSEHGGGAIDREKYRDYSYSIVQSRKVFEFLESNRE